LRLLLLCAREGNNLQTTCGGANGDLRTMGFVVSHPSPSARRMGHPHLWEVKGAPTARHCQMPQVWILRIWETSEAGMEENKKPLVEVHRLPGPQKRGTGATLILVGIEP
jgi:hypothetical protein